MKRFWTTGFILGSMLIFLQVTTVYSSDARPTKLRAKASGFNEVPALVSSGHGHFKAKINPEGTEVTYALSYEGMEGNVFMAHIHFGQHFTNGGIMVWFCGDPASPIFPPPPSISVPLCGATEGSFEGSFTAADVLGPGGQGIAPGEFEKFVHALEKGLSYVNIHSDIHIPGEIRGQIRTSRKKMFQD